MLHHFFSGAWIIFPTTKETVDFRSHTFTSFFFCLTHTVTQQT